jgi:hypothetical protein
MHHGDCSRGNRRFTGLESFPSGFKLGDKLGMSRVRGVAMILCVAERLTPCNQIDRQLFVGQGSPECMRPHPCRMVPADRASNVTTSHNRIFCLNEQLTSAIGSRAKVVGLTWPIPPEISDAAPAAESGWSPSDPLSAIRERPSDVESGRRHHRPSHLIEGPDGQRMECRREVPSWATTHGASRAPSGRAG